MASAASSAPAALPVRSVITATSPSPAPVVSPGAAGRERSGDRTDVSERGPCRNSEDLVVCGGFFAPDGWRYKPELSLGLSGIAAHCDPSLFGDLAGEVLRIIHRSLSCST